jgi:hypothetical protein
MFKQILSGIMALFLSLLAYAGDYSVRPEDGSARELVARWAKEAGRQALWESPSDTPFTPDLFDDISTHDYISESARLDSATDIDTATGRLISWLNARDGTRIVPLYVCRFAVGEVAVVIRPMADESRLHCDFSGPLS